MDTVPIGEVIPNSNLPALLNETAPSMPVHLNPPASDPWTGLVRAGWAFAMLPLVSWSAVMSSTLEALKTPRH